MERMDLPGRLVRLALLGTPALALALLADWFVGRPRLAASPLPPDSLTWLELTRLLGVGLGLLAGLAFWRRRSRLPRRLERWWPPRALACGLLLALAAATWADQRNLAAELTMAAHSLWHSLLLLTLAGWSLLVLARPAALAAPLPRLGAAADLVLANLLIFLLAVELALSVFAHYSTSKIFWDYASVQSTLRKFRQPPGSVYLGHAFNRDGYYDDEFFTAQSGDFVVALVTDSFGVGVTPKSLNFSQVLEDGLARAAQGHSAVTGRVAVHNLGIPSINLPEYLYMMEEEVARWNPAVVLVCLFVGNDLLLLDDPPYGRRSLREWWIWKLPLRLRLAMTHGTALPQATGDGAGKHGQDASRPLEDYLDPAKETPHFTPEVYLATELKRLRLAEPARPGMEENYRLVRKALKRLHEKAGGRLAVAILPDEYQVNDALWEELMRHVDPARHVRDHPQRMLLPTLRELGVPTLDLLPILRQAEADGRTYHLRDSHWNARGNRVAGDAMAAFLREHFLR